MSIPISSRNGAKPHSEDWWGLIAAHELGHAMGKGGHLPTKFDTMCCDDTVSYTSELGYTPSRKFSLSQGVWNTFVANNASNQDNYADPFATVS